MFPPWVRAIWQSLAHRALPYTNAFASPACCAQDTNKTLACSVDGLFCDDCYPSPYPWPGPLGVRSLFLALPWRRIADGTPTRSFGFSLTPNMVELAAIKTITSGSVICGNRPLSSWHFVRLPFRPVLRMILSAAALVRSAVRLLPMRLAAMLSRARLLVQAQAWFVTIWAFADNPDLVGQQCPASLLQSETTRVKRPGGFFMSAWRITPRKDRNV